MTEHGKARLNHLTSGVPNLDLILGGGFPEYSLNLIAGDPGSGKTTLGAGPPAALQMELATFLQRLTLHLTSLQATTFLVGEYGQHEPRDYSIFTIADGVVSLSALAPSFEQDFRESLYRLIGALTAEGITILMTVENTDDYTELRFSPHAVSFMTNDIVLQRYVEIESQLKRVMTVVKTRSRKHSEDIRTYEISGEGIVVGERLDNCEGIIGGIPRPRTRAERPGV